MLATPCPRSVCTILLDKWCRVVVLFVSSPNEPKYAEFCEKYLISQEASGRAVELEEIHDEDISLSKITSEHLIEVESLEPQEDVAPTYRSVRIHRALECLCLNVEVEEHSLVDFNEPTNYKVALLDPESEKWLDAMNAEMQSMQDNQVSHLVDLPSNAKTIRSKWLFKKKTDMNGKVHTYKAHLVAKGYTQTYGIEYAETFSPVADIRAIRILIAITAYYDYEIWKMDGKIAFLNGYLNEDIYMVQPACLIDPKHPRYATVVKNILKYLRDTKDMFLVYGGNLEAKLRVTCYCYAGFEPNRDDIKSQTGYVFVLNGGAID
ncbi:retrotransposon protein, putative, ty1-copia subclass [Tanacetum coccineum]